MSTWDRFYAERPLVIAHRGACDEAPENTLAAFRAAMEADADGIELDVSACATGELVVLHDNCVDRTTNSSGRVETMSLSVLRELDAGRWFDPRFAGERIPTLDEVLELVGDRLRVNIEIKGMSLRDRGVEARVAETVRRYGAQERVLISSFNPLALTRIQRAAPELQRALLYSAGQPFYLARGWARVFVRPEALHPHHRMVDAAYMRWARQSGYRVNVWTVDDPADMQRLIALGVDGIITNHPARLRALLPRTSTAAGTPF